MAPKDAPRITVDVDDDLAALVDAADLARAALLALESEMAGEGELTIVVTGDAEVAALNQRYLGHLGPTDVLSFPTLSQTPGFVTSPEMTGYLGDIVIACPYAARQAAALDRTLREELRLLVVHGVLHLLGYDHASAEEEAAMWARQRAILARLA